MIPGPCPAPDSFSGEGPAETSGSRSPDRTVPLKEGKAAFAAVLITRLLLGEEDRQTMTTGRGESPPCVLVSFLILLNSECFIYASYASCSARGPYDLILEKSFPAAWLLAITCFEKFFLEILSLPPRVFFLPKCLRNIMVNI